MTILNTPNVRITNTNIRSEGGGVDRDVIRGDWRDLTLIIHVFVDESLLGNGYRFSANFRTIEVSTNHVQNNYWNDELDNLGWGSWFWMSLSWDRARDAVPGDSGMYLFRPYFVVDAGIYGGNLYRPTGLSEFGVAEEHYFWIEKPTR